MNITRFAIFGTYNGLLQWHGVASNREDAIRICLHEIVYSKDDFFGIDLRVMEITLAQERRLIEWARRGQRSPAYPRDLPRGTFVDEATVIKSMQI